MKSYNASKTASFILDQNSVKILSSCHVLALTVEYCVTLFGKRFLGLKVHVTGVLWSKDSTRKVVYTINYKASKTACFILEQKMLQIFTACHVQALISSWLEMFLENEFHGLKLNTMVY